MKGRFVLFILLLTAYGCKKEEEHKRWTTVTVNCSNPYTGEPFDDVFIGVYESKSNGLFGDPDITLIHEGYPVNGTWYTEFKARRSSKYTYNYFATLDITKYYKLKLTPFDYLQKGTDEVFEIQVIPKAYLNFHIKNTACFDDNDEIFLKRDSQTGYQGYSEVSLYGCQDYTAAEYDFVPTGDWYFEWHVTKDGTTNVFYDTLVLNEGDSLLYEILY